MYNIIPYPKIRNYINEGDVLLFRGSSILSKFISTPSETTYSHVGIASWINGNAHTSAGILECVEFREGSGGRAINLSHAVKFQPNEIDVYRPSSRFEKLIFDNETQTTKSEWIEFDGKAVTNTMRKMTGLPYGWRRIWWMAKHKLLIVRFFVDKSKLMHDELKDIIYPVCSTAMSYSFNLHKNDLVRNRSDEVTEPGDIAKSTHLNYLFTLGI